MHVQSRSDDSRQPWVSTQGHPCVSRFTQSRSDDSWERAVTICCRSAVGIFDCRLPIADC
ncbi:hypothetical protein RISK_003808 [Rhodopirellula islandica]|uniref:Uncharacterized protein n=1 Tax=Rhodopirellula islandica TaxID=595434 RepID=A0A0J1BC81_RHOIS|nr:hypothetical protein RISK_003808 [Rhodopirellula islandica]